jgi:hypothetical protein
MLFNLKRKVEVYLLSKRATVNLHEHIEANNDDICIIDLLFSRMTFFK